MRATTIALLVVLTAPGLCAAFEVSRQGSGELSFITNGNSCWRACWMAREDAVLQMGAVALDMCPNGYKVTRPAECPWPRTDPSFLDWNRPKGWVTCRCTMTCTGEFECDQSGNTPVFFPSAAAAWREFLETFGIHYDQVHGSHLEISRLDTVSSLVGAVTANAQLHAVNPDPFLEAVEAGAVERVRPPSLEELLQELDGVTRGIGSRLLRATSSAAGPSPPGEKTPSRAVTRALVALVGILLAAVLILALRHRRSA